MADDQQYDLTTAVQDQDFLKASVPDKIAFLSAHDSDFAKAHPKDQAAYISHITGSDQPTGFEEERTPKTTGEKVTAPLDTEAKGFWRTNPISRGLSSIGSTVAGGLSKAVTHPIDTAAGVLENIGDIATLGLTQGSPLGEAARTWANPETRPTWEGVKSVLPEALGQGVGNVILGEAGGEAAGVIPKVGRAATRAVADKYFTPPVAPGLSDIATQNLAEPIARRGVEKVFKGAAPAGGDIAFREKLAIAAPDLAEVERAAPLGKAGKTGGIVNPDMRVRQTVANIDKQLDTIWQEQRQPQIDRNADAHTVTRGELFAGMDADRVANIEKRLNQDVPENLNVGQADKLLKDVNARLRKSEGLDPQSKALAQILQPILEDLDTVKGRLHESIGNELERRGEPGIKDFNRRYGALSEVRDTLRTRMNPNEVSRLMDDMRLYGGLRGPGLLERIHLRPSPGRMIQKGLENLGESGLRPTVPGPNPPPIAGLLPPPTPVLAPPADTSGPIRGGPQPMVWTPEMINQIARERAAAPPAVAAQNALEPIGSVANEQALGTRGEAGTRFGPKALLPAPAREGPVGRIPPLGGPVTAPMWGRPVVQGKPGWEVPETELMGPWGGSERPPIDIKPISVTEAPRTATRVLPGMEEAVAKQAEGAARVKGEELTREANTPKNIEEAAGEMERKSPLFRGTAASPQGELLEPRPRSAQAEAMRIAGEAQRQEIAPPTPEEEQAARTLIRNTVEILQSSDRPGRKFIENPMGEYNPQRIQSSEKGVQAGGHWIGIKSGRGMMGWLENESATPSDMLRAVERAEKGQASPVYDRLVRKATIWLRSRAAQAQPSAAAPTPEAPPAIRPLGPVRKMEF